MYYEGQGVEKDKKKQAAIGGHPIARHNLGVVERENGRMEGAVKHWIIAFNLGYDNSLDVLKSCYRKGFVRKEGFTEAFCAHQVTADSMKSPQRNKAKVALSKLKAARAARQN